MAALTRVKKIEDESRYKDTTIIEEDNIRYNSLWERPDEINKLLDDSKIHMVREHEVGRLDLVAYQYYKNVKLWWIIGAVNEMVDCIEEMYPGKVLRIPNYNKVIKYLIRGSDVR